MSSSSIILECHHSGIIVPAWLVAAMVVVAVTPKSSGGRSFLP